VTVRMSIFRKLPHLDQRAFETYWRDEHAPIALKIPLLERYEQNCATGSFQSGDPALFRTIDGVCKLFFGSAEAMQGVMSPEMAQMLREDEARFLHDLKTFVVSSRRVVPPSEDAGIKCISFVTRRTDLDETGFEGGWTGAHARWLASQPEVCGYVQNFVVSRTAERVPADYEAIPIDCVDEIWLTPELEALERFVQSVHEHAASHAAALNTFPVNVNVPTMPER